VTNILVEDVKDIKLMLMKNANAGTNLSTVSDLDSRTTPPQIVTTLEQRLEKLYHTFQELFLALTTPSSDVTIKRFDKKTIKLMLSTMTMYVKNILNNPTVARYRRIMTTNSSFKSSIGLIELKILNPFFESIGLMHSSNCYEFLWTPEQKKHNTLEKSAAIQHGQPLSRLFPANTSNQTENQSHDIDEDMVIKILSTCVSLLDRTIKVIDDQSSEQVESTLIDKIMEGLKPRSNDIMASSDTDQTTHLFTDITPIVNNVIDRDSSSCPASDSAMNVKTSSSDDDQALAPQLIKNEGTKDTKSKGKAVPGFADVSAHRTVRDWTASLLPSLATRL
jgi:hypothetical protein